MRVSDWVRSSGNSSAESSPPPGQTTSPPPPPPPPAAPPAPSASAAGGEEESIGLPVDLLRLLGGLWQRRLWVIIGSLIGLLLGLGYGFVKSKTRYEVTLQLIKRDVPSAFRASEIGEAFRPRQFSGATLVGIATSDNVLRRVAKKSPYPISLPLLRQSVDVQEQRGTDYVNLNLSGYHSAEATVTLANIWAQEVVDFSREMQARESREMRQYLQQQLSTTDADLQRINANVLDYARQEGLVAADKQIDAYLRTLGDLDLRYETARLDLASAEHRIENLKEELTHQSPLSERLSTALAELEDARAHYTDINPIVQEKKEKVETLKAQLNEQSAATSDDLSRFAGTFLGNTIYLQIIELENKKKSLSEQLVQYARLREAKQAELKSIPEKELGYAQLARAKQTLEASRALMSSRLREAQLFEERSPGYYQIFLPASIDNVASREKLLKVAVYSVAGMIALSCLALGLALLTELLDGTLRTGSEAAKALGTTLFAALPASGLTPTSTREIASRVWLRWLGQHSTGGHVRVAWSPAQSESETDFWQIMIEEARLLRPDLLIVNFSSGMSPAALATLPVSKWGDQQTSGTGPRCVTIDPSQLSIEQTRVMATELEQLARQGREIWCRCEGPVREPLSTLARQMEGALIIVSLNTETMAFWREQAEHLRESVGTPKGIVALNAVEWMHR